MNIPAATYRIQFNHSFNFRQATPVAGYLADLGVSHLYASPIFKARRGSRHGYDGVDPNRLNPELGSAVDFKSLVGELHRHSMGWLQDIVPNHMAFDRQNQMLMDVLENGPYSKYHHFFDIAWNHPYETMHDRVLAPFLGKRYSECLVNGEITVSYDSSGLNLNYYDLKLPLRIDSYPNLLESELESLEESLGREHPDYISFIDTIELLESLSLQKDKDERSRQIRLIKKTLWDLYGHNPVIKQYMDAKLKIINGNKENAESFTCLDHLVSRQLFCLCYWKTATEEINYRRFFDINELIALRQEHREVFEQTHAFLQDLVKKGIITGIRIDHIDGLSYPTGYLHRLRRRFGDVYIVVEKILGPQEELSSRWPVQGTTGYDFGQILNGLFCDRQHAETFHTIYAGFIRQDHSFEQRVYSSKRRVLATQLGGELDNLARCVKKICARNRYGIDITLPRLKAALTEFLARFPVYRTYLEAEEAGETDRRYIQSAVESAVLHKPRLQPELGYIMRLMLAEFSPNQYTDGGAALELRRQAVARFQQLSAPLMAKGFEDTALYVYNRLISLNEVGGVPDRFGCSAAAFHEFMDKRMKMWPHSMNSIATHDSKRGEDVRARINVLSELPEEWEINLKTWFMLNRGRKDRINGHEAPDKNDEYFLYQTLLGSFPPDEAPSLDYIARIREYVVKSAREAKVHTSWLEPNVEYEAALVSFVEKILSPSGQNPFLSVFMPFFKKIAFFGIFNSLSQTLIKITAPGVPDFYQGTELLDLNLVDPDNRRPVDFAQRSQFLAKIREKFAADPLTLIAELLFNRDDGRIKLFLIAVALQARKDHAALFENGTYIPLKVEGRYKHHIIAFARCFETRYSLTIVPRFLTTLVKARENPLGSRFWQDTQVALPQKTHCRWENVFTKEALLAESSLQIGHTLRHFPAALLIGEIVQ
jgi:(1->4)-alpha-D-glucan 1-alpha-D-glucosylmutase